MKFQVLTLCLIFGLAAAQSAERSRESIETTRKTGPFGIGGEEKEVKHVSSGRYRRTVGEEDEEPVRGKDEEETHVQHELVHGLSRGKEESGFRGREERKEKSDKMMKPLKEKVRLEIGHEKKEHLFFDKAIEYFVKHPRTVHERECFEKNLKPGLSIDFVVDLAPSPSSDEIDKLCADSPIALLLERTYRTPSRAYFGAIQFFIDAVTIDMKPELTHSIIFEQGRKFFIRGRGVEDCEAIERLSSKGEFMDVTRNLKTLWPVCTKEVNSKLESIVKNNLGRMTKLALWNRDNGLPTVLSSTRRSKPGLIFVITDGASGTKITDLTEDLSRTIVIDIGNHRFVDTLKWDEVRRIVGTYELTAPQQLPLMLDTARNMVCRVLENVNDESAKNVM